MKICFTGDVFLGGDLNHKSCKNIVNVDLFLNADVRIVNLEQPISNNNKIENKSTLYTDSFAISQLKELKVHAVNIANNHIHDKGLDGIKETICHLDNAKIGSFGAGKNIFEAEKVYWINEEIAILGYCEFEKSYLNQVAVGTETSPGINPLRLKKIKSDLNNLPKGAKVILYFHWGMEHVWLPPPNDISLAKKLLEDERIISIIGSHPHRVQGIINHAGKKAFMCLGNFIFPNFYIKSPTQIYYPSNIEKKKIQYTTSNYLNVFKPTYKKWLGINRVSMLVELCTKSNIIKTKLVVQDDSMPKIYELNGLSLFFYNLWIVFLSLIYKLPKTIYLTIFLIHKNQVQFMTFIKKRFFHLKQLGYKNFIFEVIKSVKKKNR